MFMPRLPQFARVVHRVVACLKLCCWNQPVATCSLCPHGSASLLVISKVETRRSTVSDMSAVFAQVAFIGFAVQALVTREQPIEGLTNHLSNPFGHNIVSNIGNLPVSLLSASN